MITSFWLDLPGVEQSTTSQVQRFSPLVVTLSHYTTFKPWWLALAFALAFSIKLVDFASLGLPALACSSVCLHHTSVYLLLESASHAHWKQFECHHS